MAARVESHSFRVLSVILEAKRALSQLEFARAEGGGCLGAGGAAQEGAALAISTDLELYIHFKCNLSCKNQNQIGFGFVNLISVAGGGGGRSQNLKTEPNEVCCSLFVDLRHPGKIYLYKNCS